MKPPLYVPAREGIGTLRALRQRTVEEIALANNRIAGLQAAIASKRKYLARLESQLALAGEAGQPAPLVVG